MKKLTLMLAAGAGYVLGTRAGRERYDQIKRTVSKVRNDPRVQEKAKQASDLAKEKAPVATQKVAEAATSAASAATSAAAAAAHKVHGSSDPEPDPELLEKLNPESTARQPDAHPKDVLP